MTLATIPDLLRLLAVPVFAWVAWRDVETRRVPHRTWLPLAALAVLTLGWDALVALNGTPFETRAFLIRAAVSLGFVAPLSYGFWWVGGFGGADAKAFIVIAALFPTYPAYELAGWAFPIQPTLLGVFSMTILTNTVLVAATYPLALLVRNALAGRFSPASLVGIPVDREAIPRTHGRLLETPAGLSRGGLDLDALRMYLRWRGLTLPALVADAERYRDPATLPAEPNEPGDGAVGAEPPAGTTTPSPEQTLSEDGGAVDDPWGADAFLADIDHGAYGTTSEQLREGLDVLVAEESVWVSPGMPFLVPLFVGLLVALTYGDLLFGLLGAFGLV